MRLRMSKVNIEPGEVVLADLNPTRSSTLKPVLWLLILTAGCFAILGVLDQWLDACARYYFGGEVNPPVVLYSLIDPNADKAIGVAVWARRITLIVTLLLSWRLCFRYLLFRSRSRLIITDRRMITASGHVRSRVMEVPMEQIVHAQARRSTIDVYVSGMRTPMRLTDVPYPKRVVKMLRRWGGHYS